MLSIKTNLSNLIIQNSLNKSTNKLNEAIERMSTGYKINHAKDNAANYSISQDMSTKISSYEVAEDNVSMGLDLVNTASDIISQMQTQAGRLESLCIQARNGTYGEQSLNAIQTEANAILLEINRLYQNSEYNKVSLFNRKEYTIAPHLPQAGESGFIDETAVSGADPPPMAKAEYGGFIADPKSYEDSYVDGLTSVLAAVNSTGLEANKEYKVANKDDLSALATFVNNGGDTTDMTFILANDIDLSSISNWTPIGREAHRFKGTFDGNGHAIKNLEINFHEVVTYVGFFGYTALGSIIKNLKLQNGNVKGYDSVGSLVGESNSEIINCYSNLNVSARTYNAGGLVGDSNANIENCYATGNVSALQSDVGGLVGDSVGDIKNCFATGDVNGSLIQVGGLVGLSSGTITNSYSTGDITGQSIYIGGLVGNSSNAVTNCYATGDVNGQGNYVGGLIGISQNNSTVTNSYATGDVTGQGSYVGGLIGQSKAVTNCYATGDVMGQGGGVGGLIGKATAGSITNSYAKGDVTGYGIDVGGVVGVSYAPLKVCYATGFVTGNSGVGGLGGEITATVNNCYSTGSVVGNGWGIGGLVGQAYKSVTNCYATGDVNGQSSHVGGLIGKIHSPSSDAQIDACVSYGTSSSGYFIGAIANSTDGVNFTNISITNCQAMPSENDAIGVVLKYDGADVILPDYDKSAWLAGISDVEVFDIKTDIQAGISSESNGLISFNTNFKYSIGSVLDVTSDKALKDIKKFVAQLNTKQTELGAVQNRLDSALTQIGVNIENLISSRSTIRDADIAEVSSEYVKQQILQEASATLLSATQNIQYQNVLGLLNSLR